MAAAAAFDSNVDAGQTNKRINNAANEYMFFLTAIASQQTTNAILRSERFRLVVHEFSHVCPVVKPSAYFVKIQLLAPTRYLVPTALVRSQSQGPDGTAGKWGGM